MSRVLLALLPALAAAAVLPGDLDSCNPDKLTVYRMVLHTYWTREKFPKHYPDWRPPAQWSKVYGVSHNSSHVLFRLGRRVSAAVRLFAESGRADALGGGGGGGGGAGALDAFSAPPVPAGAGRTDATFFVDGNHSRVSVMARMVPSPDWFIGIDSFDLCVDGNWLDSITIEVDPIDAGTDNGFTFTAPDWPTAPQGVAYRITARYPAHPAGSFFYPHLRRLPPIATVQFIKLREYELSEVFHRASDERRYDVLQLERLAHTRDQPADGNRALSLADEAERAEQPLTPSAYDYYSLSTGNLSTTEQPRSANEIPTPAGVEGAAGAAGAAGAERSALRSLARRYRARRRRKMYPDNADPAQRRKRKRARLLDCRVSAWGEWSACRGEGGCVGSALRTRRVLRRARPGGAPCPPTAQSRWCAANCTQTTHDDEDWHNNLT